MSGKNIYPYIGLSGQMPLLNTFQSFLDSKGLKRLSICPTTSGIWKVSAGNNSGDLLIETLYGNAATALDRKNKRAQAIISGNIRMFPPYIEEPSCRAVEGTTILS
jgi:hypothetical protein